jgi:hypothetical protein
MGVYTVTLPDSTLLKAVNGLKSVVILGCFGCANESLAFDTDQPSAKIEVNRDTGERKEVPLLIIEESNRLKRLFESNGISAVVETPLFPLCYLTDETDKALSELSDHLPEDVDAIVALYCPAGIMALKKCLPKPVKIVPAMKTLGILQMRKVHDESKGFVFLDKNKSTKILMFKGKILSAE